MPRLCVKILVSSKIFENRESSSELIKPVDQPQRLKPDNFAAEYRRHKCLLHPVLVDIRAENA